MILGTKIPPFLTLEIHVMIQGCHNSCTLVSNYYVECLAELDHPKKKGKCIRGMAIYSNILILLTVPECLHYQVTMWLEIGKNIQTSVGPERFIKPRA